MPQKVDPQRIVTTLTSYRDEAETARNSGWGQREDIWESNADLYWSRYDFSGKAEWQSKEALPEAALYIDRWAAALRAALIVPGVWYSVDTHAPELELAFRKFLGYWLERCGTTPTGYHVGFDRVFEDQAKLAALMACSASVGWEAAKDGGGRVRVDTVDPREVLLDPTNRGLYRVRRREVDYYQLVAEANRDPDLYNMEEIERLAASRAEELEGERQELVGHDTGISSVRRPIVLDEFLAVILDDDGRDMYGERQLAVIANSQYLIRGPEANPFLHGRDWLVFSPAITVPLSVYGKTYVETWGDIARTFVKMTNLIIDAAMMAAMNAFVLNADGLADPEQVTSGVFPNKTFVSKPGVGPGDVLTNIPLGTLSTAAVTVWTALKQEMREGAATNDLDLGQAVPKGDVTATEINEVKAGGTALIQSIATSLETGCVDPLLNLIFQTALQHAFVGVEPDGAGGYIVPPSIEPLRVALGNEYFNMFVTRWQEILQYAPVFRARGISGLIERSKKLQSMLQVLQAMGSSPVMQQALLQSIGFSKFVRQMVILVGLDPNDFPPDQISQMAMTAAQPQPAAAPGAGNGASRPAAANA